MRMRFAFVLFLVLGGQAQLIAILLAAFKQPTQLNYLIVTLSILLAFATVFASHHFLSGDEETSQRK